MPGFARFSVSSPSRHPANLNAYDSDDHRYLPEYVNPDSWVLGLSFFPRGLSEPSEGKLELPKEIISFGWTVEQLEGPFSLKSGGTRTSFRLTTEVRVPKPGDYKITLRVNLAGGTQETATRNYRLRDFLIVGIGDSFASGQGNPDVPAIPAPDQQLVCKSTSLAILAARVEEFLSGLREIAHDKVKEAVEYLPFVGKIGLAGLTAADDIREFIEDKIDDLKDFVVDVVRDVEATIVEGAEEVFGFLGIGDGGESEETRPRRAAWQEAFAYRSYRSGQSLAAREIERENAFGADRITFLSFGRTGSEIEEGLLGPRTVEDVLGNKQSIDGWTRNRGQVAEAKDTVLSRPIDALVVTIGINDIGFSSLVQRAILKASGGKRKERVQGAKNRIAVKYSNELEKLKTAIDKSLNPRHVFITQYPIGIFKEIANGVKPCGVLGTRWVVNPATGLDFEGLDLDESDAKDYGQVGALLNEKIREKAEEFGWVLVDGIEQGFDGHGYCAKKPFFVSAEESCLNQGDFEGMLHPNKSGHDVTRDCIAETVRRHLFASDWLEPALQVMMS